MTSGTNPWEPLTMVCHPAIHLVLNRTNAGYLIQNPEQGKTNHDVKGGTYGLSSLITSAIGRDRPDDPFTWCHSQSICLRKTRCLKRKTVEAESPVQNRYRFGRGRAKVTASIEVYHQLLAVFHALSLSSE